jgi:hypothetical protein
MVLQQVYRVTIFVPPEHVDALPEGVEREVPLKYGLYDRAAWWSAVGVEQFRPLPGANPTFGEVGRTERVPTVRIEFAIPRDPVLLTRLLTRGLIPNHPRQEPAIFIDESQVAASHPGEGVTAPGGSVAETA